MRHYRPREKDPDRARHLTYRETQLIALLTTGASNKKIAGILGIAEGTIKVYFTHLFAKVGVDDRLGLALYGFRLGVAELQKALNPDWQRPTITDPEPSADIPMVAMLPSAPREVLPVTLAPHPLSLPMPKNPAPVSKHARLRKEPRKSAKQLDEDERWNRIFDEKFRDPDYYAARVTRIQSPLCSL